MPNKRSRKIFATGFLLTMLLVLPGPALAGGGGDGCSATIKCDCECTHFSTNRGGSFTTGGYTNLGSRDVGGEKSGGTCYPYEGHNGLQLCLDSYQNACIDYCQATFGSDTKSVTVIAKAAEGSSRESRTINVR